jgi:hypothetical protein
MVNGGSALAVGLPFQESQQSTFRGSLMAEAIHNAHQEFWQPPSPSQVGLPAVPVSSEACQRCATEYLIGARFCHACGTPRVQADTPEQASNTSTYASTVDLLVEGVTKLRSTAAEIPWNKISLPAWIQYLHFHQIKRWIGLPTASLIAFFAGLGCVLGAIGVSLVYKAQNFVDFQAIQMWRIEWLLAATASFVAGILLKKPSDNDPD